MKLAFAIVLCIGLYLCAVSEAGFGSNEGSSSSYDEGLVPLLKPAEGDVQGKKSLVKNCGNLIRNIVYPKDYNAFINNRAADSDHFLKNKQGFEDYKRYMEFLGSNDPKYQRFNKDYQGFKDYEEHQQHVQMVEQKFEKIINWCKFYIGDFEKLSPWDNFEFADLDFKMNCIESFEKKTKSDINNKGLETLCPEVYRYAHDVIKEQTLDFIKNLLSTFFKSTIDSSQIAKLNICWEEQLLEIIKFWFAPDCDLNDLNTEIRNMAAKYNLANDDAAKVMVMFEKFPISIVVNGVKSILKIKLKM